MQETLRLNYMIRIIYLSVYEHVEHYTGWKLSLMFKKLKKYIV